MCMHVVQAVKMSLCVYMHDLCEYACISSLEVLREYVYACDLYACSA